jgi:hypothetical protein
MRLRSFRNIVFRYLLASPRVAWLRHDPAARQLARDALAVAAETTPSFPRHPGAGRPSASEDEVAELEKIPDGRSQAPAGIPAISHEEHGTPDQPDLNAQIDQRLAPTAEQKGLAELTWAGVVEHSERIACLEQGNRAHPQHEAERFSRLRHYILPLKEGTVEGHRRDCRSATAAGATAARPSLAKSVTLPSSTGPGSTVRSSSGTADRRAEATSADTSTVRPSPSPRSRTVSAGTYWSLRGRRLRPSCRQRFPAPRSGRGRQPPPRTPRSAPRHRHHIPARPQTRTYHRHPIRCEFPAHHPKSLTTIVMAGEADGAQALGCSVEDG